MHLVGDIDISQTSSKIKDRELNLWQTHTLWWPNRASLTFCWDLVQIARMARPLETHVCIEILCDMFVFILRIISFFFVIKFVYEGCPCQEFRPRDSPELWLKVGVKSSWASYWPQQPRENPTCYKRLDKPTYSTLSPQRLFYLDEALTFPHFHVPSSPSRPNQLTEEFMFMLPGWLNNGILLSSSSLPASFTNWFARSSAIPI